MAERVWKVHPSHKDTIRELFRLHMDHQISSHDFIEKLRSLGFPHGAVPGDTIRIESEKQTIIHGRAI